MLKYQFHALFKLHKRIKSVRVKLLGVFIASKLGFRFLSVRIDPILACNLRCTMCSFSSADYRKQRTGQLRLEEIENIARILFPKSFQVVVGCGAEPTLHKHFPLLIKLAKHYGVPNVSLVSNGLLLDKGMISLLIDEGLDELILSMHGLSKDIYEKFMVHAHFTKFISVLKEIEEIKTEKKSILPQIRINYTVNDENLEDLKNFQQILGGYKIKTLQIRPIRNTGGQYQHALTLKKRYNEIIDSLLLTVKDNGTTVIAGLPEASSSAEGEELESKTSTDQAIVDAVYRYISPETSKALGFSWNNLSFSQYTSSIKWNKKIRQHLFFKKVSIKGEKSKKNHLNYEIIDL